MTVTCPLLEPATAELTMENRGNNDIMITIVKRCIFVSPVMDGAMLIIVLATNRELGNYKKGIISTLIK